MKIQDSQLDNFLAICLKAETIVGLVKTGSTAFQEMGFANFIFHYIPHLGSQDYKSKKICHVPEDYKDFLFNTFPKHMNVSPRDPFEDFVLKTGHAVWTSDLKTHAAFQSNDQQVFWRIMESYFGLSLVVPAYGHRRSRATIFLPRKKIEKKLNVRDTASIEYMCSFFHLCYTKLRTENEEAPSLTPREYEVLQLVSLGLTNREIANRLKISTHTVNGYLKQLFEKLDVTDRVLVTQRAIALDLIE